MQNLNQKYRPQEFSEVISQGATIKVLEKQIETRSFKNTYLFCGPSGVGKTTLARILANKINKGIGHPIEIDAASNNSVEDVRQIVSSANERSLDSEYKIVVMDEVHALSSAAWQAFLKTIEEPPVHTIFMFCTTDPQKVPNTIQNRCQKFSLTKVDTKGIYDRLVYICKQENFTNYEESCEFISKLCNGCMRQAIAYLEKCASYSTELKIENALMILGDFSYNTLFDLTNAIIDKNEAKIISIVEDIHNKGNDMKMFIDQYLDFLLDLTKYCIFRDIKVTKIPSSLESVKDSPRCVTYVTGVYEKKEDNTKFYNYMVEKVLEIKNMIKYDTSMKNTIEIMFLSLSRGQ